MTEGILSKVSFGVRLPAGTEPVPAPGKDDLLLKVSVSQDPVRLQPHLEVTAARTEKGILFQIACNYALFLKKGELVFFDGKMARLSSKELPRPLPSRLELAPEELPEGSAHYQLLIYDAQDRQDRTSIAKLP